MAETRYGHDYGEMSHRLDSVEPTQLWWHGVAGRGRRRYDPVRCAGLQRTDNRFIGNGLGRLLEQEGAQHDPNAYHLARGSGRISPITRPSGWTSSFPSIRSKVPPPPYPSGSRGWATRSVRTILFSRLPRTRGPWKLRHRPTACGLKSSS